MIGMQWLKANYYSKIDLLNERLNLRNKTLVAPAISSPVITGSFGAWTALAFNTGWDDYGGVYQTGQYRKVGDIVFLRGLVVRSSGIETVIATLPVGYRPSAFWHNAAISNNAFAEIDINTAGQIDIPVGSPTVWVSLNGVFFFVT